MTIKLINHTYYIKVIYLYKFNKQYNSNYVTNYRFHGYTNPKKKKKKKIS
jgi:hypothetical protein